LRIGPGGSDWWAGAERAQVLAEDVDEPPLTKIFFVQRRGGFVHGPESTRSEAVRTVKVVHDVDEKRSSSKSHLPCRTQLVGNPLVVPIHSHARRLPIGETAD